MAATCAETNCGFAWNIVGVGPFKIYITVSVFTITLFISYIVCGIIRVFLSHQQSFSDYNTGNSLVIYECDNFLETYSLLCKEKLSHMCSTGTRLLCLKPANLRRLTVQVHDLEFNEEIICTVVSELMMIDIPITGNKNFD
jgi:hypothetical protein